MTMRTVTENGTTYTIDDNGMVVEAKQDAPVAELNFEEEPLRIGDRVEVDGRLGKVVTYTPSVYGDALAVRFDDGDLGEFLASDLERTSEDQIHFDQPIDEVKSDWETYQAMPEFTLAEVDSKAAVARRLNVTAKALVTDARTPLTDRVELDHVILATGTDLFDLRDKAERLNVVEHEDYLSRLPKYQMDSDFAGGYNYAAKDDISWVLAAAEMATEELGNLDWNQHLTNEALKATARLTAEQLENKDFMDRVASYCDDAMPSGYDVEKKAQFRTLLSAATKNALAEREAQHVAKVARVEEELDDFDTTMLYL